MAISYQSGLIEVVPNSVSLDKLKTFFEVKGEHSLLDFFNNEWPDPKDFERSRSNFVSSLAAYSIICYLLQIKDRHNGNIMLDSEGVLFHIDFGYLLARTIKFEKAPFKLTEEFIEVMGGDQSKAFKDYCTLCVQGFVAARKHYEKILLLVEMTISDSAAIPCLERDSITKNLRKRFHLEWNEAQCEEYIMNLLLEARENWRTQVRIRHWLCTCRWTAYVG
jgi:phosphatidylinositol 4-kinase